MDTEKTAKYTEMKGLIKGARAGKVGNKMWQKLTSLIQ